MNSINIDLRGDDASRMLRAVTDNLDEQGIVYYFTCSSAGHFSDLDLMEDGKTTGTAGARKWNGRTSTKCLTMQSTFWAMSGTPRSTSKHKQWPAGIPGDVARPEWCA